MVGPAERARTLKRIRALCLALPETSERLSHGAPTFFVREKKCFLMLVDNHHDDGRFAIWCAAPPGNQELLGQADPDRFFVPRYTGKNGWIGARLDRKPDWDEIAELVEESWRRTAPKKLVAQLESGTTAG